MWVKASKNFEALALVWIQLYKMRASMFVWIYYLGRAVKINLLGNNYTFWCMHTLLHLWQDAVIYSSVATVNRTQSHRAGPHKALVAGFNPLQIDSNTVFQYTFSFCKHFICIKQWNHVICQADQQVVYLLHRNLWHDETSLAKIFAFSFILKLRTTLQGKDIPRLSSVYQAVVLGLAVAYLLFQPSILGS